jgi:hypothetical protein
VISRKLRVEGEGPGRRLLTKKEAGGTAGGTVPPSGVEGDYAFFRASATKRV